MERPKLSLQLQVSVCLILVVSRLNERSTLTVSENVVLTGIFGLRN